MFASASKMNVSRQLYDMVIHLEVLTTICVCIQGAESGLC